MVSRFLFCGRVHPREQDEMEQSGVSTIDVPRAMIFGLILAPLLPGFAAVVDIIGDPRLHAVRGVEILRRMAIGWCAGIFFCGLLLLIRSKAGRS